jgi:hypothetical protein
MKKLILLAMIMAVGFPAYSQSTRTSREKKNEKTETKKEATRESAVKTQERTQAATQQRTQAATQQRTQAATQQRTQSATQARSRVANESRNQAQSKQNPARPAVRTAPQKSAVRIQHSENPAEVRISNSSANRVYREDQGTLTRDDGKVIRHQNNIVFTGNKYKAGRASYADTRRSDDFRMTYRNYNNWYDKRYVRNVYYTPGFQPVSLEIRRDRYVYRQPMSYQLIWTPSLFNRFMYYYPGFTDWNIEFGNEIETISSYDVAFNVGTVKRIYGKVEEVYYSAEDQNYVLYMGDRFPYHDLSVVIPRNIARRISASPEWYFDNEYIWFVGLIEMWEDKPEIIIRDEEQIRKY